MSIGTAASAGASGFRQLGGATFAIGSAAGIGSAIAAPSGEQSKGIAKASTFGMWGVGGAVTATNFLAFDHAPTYGVGLGLFGAGLVTVAAHAINKSGVSLPAE